MNNKFYLAFDTEFTGFHENASLLTAYFALLDEYFNLVDDLELNLIPDDGIYIVDPKSLLVNKIDLARLGEVAITYKQAKTKLFNFISTAYGNQTYSGYAEDMKLQPLGQGISGDIRLITKNLIAKGTWDSFVSYRVRDTGVVANFLKDQGKLPRDLNTGLASLADYFRLVPQGELHTAKTDTLLSVEVYKELLKL